MKRGIDLAVEGSLGDLSADTLRSLVRRNLPDTPELVDGVRAILDDVRTRGDEALRAMASRFDGVALEELEVPRRRWDEALEALDPSVASALRRAAGNIEAFHRAQLPEDVTVEVEPGVRITRRWTPLPSVGVYAPGGRAAYPSSVLMGVVPARAAGVEEVVVCAPPGPSGEPPPEVLAACALGGADRLFALGGAGAVAALAFGTETVPAVDLIVGPGNRWVTEAKRQVAGRVPIDAPAGPSEILVVADDTADPVRVCRELLAQAEHDPDAAAVLVSPSGDLLREVRHLLADMVAREPRRDVIAEALAGGGALLLARDLGEALAFARAYAPEHLSVMTADAPRDAGSVTTAGTVFVGGAASVAFGDYLTGANHVLPTAGRARSYSGLSVTAYLRSYTVQEITPDGAAAMADDVAVLARAEGLPAHASAALESAS